jgi:hypothetical protein
MEKIPRRTVTHQHTIGDWPPTHSCRIYHDGWGPQVELSQPEDPTHLPLLHSGGTRDAETRFGRATPIQSSPCLALSVDFYQRPTIAVSVAPPHTTHASVPQPSQAPLPLVSRYQVPDDAR